MNLETDFEALPKIELHAHLTGSISRQTLHEIWLRKQQARETELEDPLAVMPEGKFDYNLETRVLVSPQVPFPSWPFCILALQPLLTRNASFFPLFSSYIYALLPDRPSLAYATLSVLQHFQAQSTAYLELRTTPRRTSHLSPEDYVSAILDTISSFEAQQETLDNDRPAMHTRLILSVDRRHSLATAEETLALALKFRSRGVVGLDLCGDPTARTSGAISLFTPVFQRAASAGLGLTVHFAEAPQAASREELETILSWNPGRLGHVIWESEDAKAEIVKRGLCVELCLSCNVLAKMGKKGHGFRDHHFGEWWAERDKVMIALSTDDVGVFGSSLTNEYRLIAEHFGLERQQICSLARSPIESIFAGEKEKERLRRILWAP